MSGKIFFRQLRRNSKRTWLNILLLTAAIAFFVMSVNLYQNSLRNLETAEDAFTTIALVELYGEIDKYGNIVEQGSEGHIGKHPVAVKGYDLTDIVSAEGVIDYDLRSRYAAYIPGKAVLQGSSFAMNSKDILIFRVLGDEPMVIPISHKTSYFFEPFPSEVLYTAADVYQCDPDSYAHGVLLSEEEEAYYADDIRRLNRSDICDKIILFIYQWLHLCTAIAASITSRFHRHRQIIRPAESRHKQRYQNWYHSFRFLNDVSTFQISSSGNLRFHNLIGFFQ